MMPARRLAAFALAGAALLVSLGLAAVVGPQMPGPRPELWAFVALAAGGLAALALRAPTVALFAGVLAAALGTVLGFSLGASGALVGWLLAVSAVVDGRASALVRWSGLAAAVLCFWLAVAVVVAGARSDVAFFAAALGPGAAWLALLLVTLPSRRARRGAAKGA